MAANSSSDSSITKPVLGIAALIVLFALIVRLGAGLGGGEVVVEDSGNKPPTAAELREQESEVLSSYGWVDQEKGIVRIPVERATELYLEELNQ